MGWKVKDVGLAEVDLKPGGVGTSARMYSHFLGFHLDGGLEYTEVVPEKRIVGSPGQDVARRLHVWGPARSHSPRKSSGVTARATGVAHHWARETSGRSTLDGRVTPA